MSSRASTILRVGFNSFRGSYVLNVHIVFIVGTLSKVSVCTATSGLTLVLCAGVRVWGSVGFGLVKGFEFWVQGRVQF